MQLMRDDSFIINAFLSVMNLVLLIMNIDIREVGGITEFKSVTFNLTLTAS